MMANKSLKCFTHICHGMGRRPISTIAPTQCLAQAPVSGRTRGIFSGRPPTEAGGARVASPWGPGHHTATVASRRCFSKREETIMNVFDRKTKRIQRNRTASLENVETYDYLKEEMGWRVADRICDVSRKFSVAVDVGCGRGHISKHIYKDMVEVLYQCDMAEDVLAQSDVSSEVPTYKVHCDEEFFPFKANSLDLVVSSLSLHWINNLPGVFSQIHKTLKPDGCFIGSMFGGETLFELRVSLQLAEQDLEGGIAPHISPFTSVQDLGNLLNRAGYSMLTIDVDEIVVNFPSIFELMRDLKGMGESNCAWSRKLHLRRTTTKRAAEIYKEMYGLKGEQEGIPATFNVINFIAWKPGLTQEKIAARGSGQVSLKDIDKLDQLSQQIDGIHSKTDGHSSLDSSLEHLKEQMEKLRQATVTKDDTEDNKDNSKK